MDSSDWSNGIRYHTIDTRPDTVTFWEGRCPSSNHLSTVYEYKTGGAHTAARVTSHRAAHSAGHQRRVSHRGGSGRVAVDLEVRAAMAPTKDAQKLRRAAERKGKAEDQFRLAELYFKGKEGLKQDKVAAAK
jgi:TPR repeat protein